MSDRDDDFEKWRKERRRELEELKQQLELDQVRSREKHARESDRIYKQMAELSESYVNAKNQRAERLQAQQDITQENKPD